MVKPEFSVVPVHVAKRGQHRAENRYFMEVQQMNKYSISRSGIDVFLWDVNRAVYSKLGDTKET